MHVHSYPCVHMFIISICAFYRRSMYYNKDYTDNWKRVTLPLLNQITYGTAVRLRWSQIYTVPNAPGDWAIDNIIIGNRSLHCPHLCSGHGRCTLSSACVCDEGFSGNNCEEINTVFPNYIQVEIIIMYMVIQIIIKYNYYT